MNNKMYNVVCKWRGKCKRVLFASLFNST